MKYLDTEVRDMLESDIDSVLEIENLCFKDPWKREDILTDLKQNPYSHPAVIELHNDAMGLRQVCGFCIYWVTFDSATICQIAVHPELQHFHIGSELFEEVISDIKAKKARTITLEVRESNNVAINFYKKFGFKISHTKPGYYLNGEDAIYMILEVN